MQSHQNELLHGEHEASGAEEPADDHGGERHEAHPVRMPLHLLPTTLANVDLLGHVPAQNKDECHAKLVSKTSLRMWVGGSPSSTLAWTAHLHCPFAAISDVVLGEPLLNQLVTHGHVLLPRGVASMAKKTIARTDERPGTNRG